MIELTKRQAIYEDVSRPAKGSVRTPWPADRERRILCHTIRVQRTLRKLHAMYGRNEGNKVS